MWAVKRAYVKMGVKGAGALAKTQSAGPAFVSVTKTVQRQNHLKADGVYGASTHAVVAPHFDAYGTRLYRSAKIRVPPVPPPPVGGAQAEAKRLLVLAGEGRYHADNPGDLHDITETAAGKPVWSQGGYWVHIDPRPLQLLVWLIDGLGHRIGTYAICSDHHDDGPHGHSGGLAVDVSSIDGVTLASPESRGETLVVARALHTAPGALRPRQLICDGYGGVHDAEIAACIIPYPAYYDSGTLQGHRTHIHAGY